MMNRKTSFTKCVGRVKPLIWGITKAKVVSKMSVGT